MVTTCLALIVLFVFAFFLIPRVIGFYFSVIGSENCVIASDYSSLTYYGQRYIPLPMNGLEGRVGDCMVQEAQVEGAGFLGKLFFGEALYEVKNVPDNEVVFLQTDYDGGVSSYYVLEHSYDRYVRMIQGSSLDCYYLSTEDSDGYTRELTIPCELAEDILASADNVQEIDTGRHIPLYAYDSEHIFYRWLGDVCRCDDGYYWSASEYQDRSDVHSGYYPSHVYYEIDSSLYDHLSVYFDTVN